MNATQPEIAIGTVVIRRGDASRKIGTVLSVQVNGWPGGKFGPLPSPLVKVRWTARTAKAAYLASVGFGANIGQTTTVAAARLETEDGRPLFVKPKAAKKAATTYHLYDVRTADGQLYATYLTRRAGAEQCAASIGGTVEYRQSRKLPKSYSC